jgi:hypothetical protein
VQGGQAAREGGDGIFAQFLNRPPTKPNQPKKELKNGEAI